MIETKLVPMEILHSLLKMSNADSRRVIKRMTNEEWQEVFSYMKEINQPTKEAKLRRCATAPLVISRRWSLSDNDGVITDVLTDNTYVRYINSVLKELRDGNEDHCYYIYQISDLLRFLPDVQVRLGTDGIFYCSNNK